MLDDAAVRHSIRKYLLEQVREHGRDAVRTVCEDMLMEFSYESAGSTKAAKPSEPKRASRPPPPPPPNKNTRITRGSPDVLWRRIYRFCEEIGQETYNFLDTADAMDVKPEDRPMGRQLFREAVLRHSGDATTRQSKPKAFEVLLDGDHFRLIKGVPV